MATYTFCPFWSSLQESFTIRRIFIVCLRHPGAIEYLAAAGWRFPAARATQADRQTRREKRKQSGSEEIGIVATMAQLPAYIQIYIYIYREREREREKHAKIHVYCCRQIGHALHSQQHVNCVRAGNKGDAVNARPARPTLAGT